MEENWIILRKNEDITKNRITYHPAAYHSPSRLLTWLIGRPLPTADAAHQAIGKAIGLAVFASDALSSTAYAAQEIIVILAVAGMAGLGYALPISIAIYALLVIVSGWRWKMVVNGFGAICSAIVTLIFAITKFVDGAWLVLILIPGLVSMFYAIHRHYLQLADDLSSSDYDQPPHLKRQYAILPISGVHKGTLKALRYARSLTSDIEAVYVASDEAQTQRIQDRWQNWAPEYP